MFSTANGDFDSGRQCAPVLAAEKIVARNVGSLALDSAESSVYCVGYAIKKLFKDALESGRRGFLCSSSRLKMFWQVDIFPKADSV